MSKEGIVLRFAWGNQGCFREELPCKPSEARRMSQSLLSRQTDWGNMGQFECREDNE